MKHTWRTVAVLALTALMLSGIQVSAWAEDGHVEGEGQAEESHSGSTGFRLGAQRTWLFRSFLQDEGDDADVLGIEFESYYTARTWELKNIAYFEVAQYPRNVPGQPPGHTVSPGSGAADGINDLLTAFLVSPRGGPHGKHHLSWGWAMQFPTASDKTLGSGKWSLGPSMDYEYENGDLFAGFIALQLWSYAGEEDRKDVSMLMIKPFVVYGITPNWDLLYMPYGVSVYWHKPEGEKLYLPLGGGVQRGFQLGSVDMNLAAQFFKNVIRPTKGTVYDLRFLIEFAF